MARLAAGDPAAIFSLHEHHGHRVAQVVRKQLQACGVVDIRRDDLTGLVLDACMALQQVAAGWRPDGAQPWWWAEGRIRSVVNGWVGVHADSLDDHWSSVDVAEPAVAGVSSPDESIAVTFARLVNEVPIVGLVAEAAAAARVGEAALLCMIDYAVQQRQGDPSPAHTLAPRYGVSPQTMRKRISRDRARIRVVVADNPRFAALADFMLVA